MLRLALEETRETHGDYTLNIYPYSSRARIERELHEDRHKNALHTFGYSSRKEGLKGLAFVRFPVFLGVLGYRVCFVSELAQASFAQVGSVEDLKLFTHGQGQGWTDSYVFKGNDLNKGIYFSSLIFLIRFHK